MFNKAQEIIAVANELSKVVDMVEKPFTLHFHNGSMGETSENISITVKNRDGKVLYCGMPPCIGKDSKSNYAYSEHDIVKPESSIKAWLDNQFAGKLEFVDHTMKMVNEWDSIEVSYRYNSNWENCTNNSVEIDAIYSKWFGILTMNITNTDVHTNGNEYITTIVVTDNDYAYDEQTIYAESDYDDECDYDDE
jgi:hypothetical protein